MYLASVRSVGFAPSQEYVHLGHVSRQNPPTYTRGNHQQVPTASARTHTVQVRLSTNVLLWVIRYNW